MNKKITLQLFLISILLLIIFLFFYFNNSKKKNIVLDIKDNFIAEVDSANVIKEIKYNSYDAQGNEYKIIAQEGEVDIDNSEIIFMTGVTATINLKDKNRILIFSDYAKYNNLNNNTDFTENIILTYMENKIFCEKLDLSFENNLVTLSDNLIYKNNLTILKADKLEIDLITKDSKIFMENKSKKIKILQKY
tara:strand:- start:149 stop:724 length:576 start_codon:yes stop_codon:yes gene_type:complete